MTTLISRFWGTSEAPPIGEYKKTDSLETILKLEDDKKFQDLSPKEKDQIIRRIAYLVYDGKKTVQLTDLKDTDSVFPILMWGISHELTTKKLKRADKFYEKITSLISNDLSLTPDQKVALGVALLFRKGVNAISQEPLAPVFAEQNDEISEQYKNNFDELYPELDVQASEGLDELKKHAFRVLDVKFKPGEIGMHLLYAEKPDVEAIAFVINQCQAEKRKYYWEHGISNPARAPDVPEETLDKIKHEKEMTVMHAGGMLAIEEFLSGEGNPILVHHTDKLDDKRLLPEAQEIAWNSGDFPAFLRATIATKDIYGDHKDKYFLKPGELEKFEVFPLPISAIKMSHADRAVEDCFAEHHPEMAEKIKISLKENRIVIPMPTDKVPESPPKPVDETSSSEEATESSWTWKGAFGLAFKCLLGVLLVYLGYRGFLALRQRYKLQQ